MNVLRICILESVLADSEIRCTCVRECFVLPCVHFDNGLLLLLWRYQSRADCVDHGCCGNLILVEFRSDGVFGILLNLPSGKAEGAVDAGNL